MYNARPMALQPFPLPVQTLYADLAQKLANAPSPPAAKRQKDLRQASILFETLDQAAPDELEDALDDARGRGRKWQRAINASPRTLGIDR